jgi:acetyl-CoA acetyltransferase
VAPGTRGALMYRADAAIVGIGTSMNYGFDLGMSPLLMQAEALADALADAGLDKSDIDGFATAHGSPQGADYEEFILGTGLSVRWVSQMWTHGRWASTMVAQAALAVAADMANYVVIANASTTRRAYGRHLSALGGHGHEGSRDVGGGHGEWDLHGIDSPGAATALVARRYMDRYGATSDDLADIAVSIRAFARQNPMAIMRDKPMTRESYYSEPVIAAPFRRADFCLANDGAACLIVTTAERARDLRQPTVLIRGMEGISASRDDYILFARPGLGAGISQEAPYRPSKLPAVFRMADATPADMDALYAYDSFTSNVWMVLERFGFCREGEAAQYIRDKGIGPGSPLPVNTNGGLLSEAHLIGINHLVEMVRQLRGTAGQRQLPRAELLQWATPAGDSLIMGRP